MPQYVKFAGVYDKMEADHHSRQMCTYTFEILRKYNINVTEALDLCCGTGSAVEVFAKHGFEMSGLDGSKDMLAVARKKLKGRGVKLYHQELPRFKIPKAKGSGAPKQFDLVTCFYDSLNYMLTKKDLKAAFGSVYRHLKKGGWFIFDMNTANALKTLWDGSTYAESHDELAWIWKNYWDHTKQMAACDATFFVKKGKGWQKFNEVHHERAYSNTEIRKMLREVGFVIKGYFRCLRFEKVTRDTNRICVVVQRVG